MGIKYPTCESVVLHPFTITTKVPNPYYFTVDEYLEHNLDGSAEAVQKNYPDFTPDEARRYARDHPEWTSDQVYIFTRGVNASMRDDFAKIWDK
jgi:hypothetical protein